MEDQPAELLEESDLVNITLNMEDKYAEIEIAGNNANEETGLKMSIGSQQAESENTMNRNDNEEFENSHEGEFEVEIVKEDSDSQKKYECKICLKRFSSQPQFESHQKIHQNEKPQECKTCGQR